MTPQLDQIRADTSIERIMALVDDYADHFADCTAIERTAPTLADVFALKVKKDRIRSALSQPKGPVERQCNMCMRKTWDAGEMRCGLAQPNGGRCPGVFWTVESAAPSV